MTIRGSVSGPSTTCDVSTTIWTMTPKAHLTTPLFAQHLIIIRAESLCVSARDKDLRRGAENANVYNDMFWFELNVLFN